MCKIKRRILAAVMGAAAMCMAVLAENLAFPAYGAETSKDGIGFAVSHNNDSEKEIAMPAVILNLGNGTTGIYSSTDMLQDGSVLYAYMSSSRENSGYMELSGVAEKMKLSEFIAEAEVGYAVALAQQDQMVKVVCLDYEAKGFIDYETILTVSSEGSEETLAGYEGQVAEIRASIFYPAAVLDQDDNCIGILYDENKVWVFEIQDAGGAGEGETGSGETKTESDETGDRGSDSGDRGSNPGGSGGETGDEAENGGFLKGILDAIKENGYIFAIAGVVAAIIGAAYVIKKKRLSSERSESQPSVQSSTGIYLRGLSGNLSGKIFPIGSEGLLIGRSCDASVRFPGDTKGVSREHCRIYWNNGLLMLQDVGSSYGTFVKGKGQLQAGIPVAIKCGDIFYIGSREQSFVLEM